MKGKTGVFGLQFNWIFVLIAGGIILGMFFAVAGSLRSGATEKINLEVSADLKSTLIGAKVSTGSSTTIPIPNVPITLEADGLKVGGLQSIRLGTIFGPRQINGNKLIVWTKDWSIPFRVSNFLYITTPKVKYYIYKDITDDGIDAMVIDLIDDIPDDVNLELIQDCDALPSSLSSALHIRVISISDIDASISCDTPELRDTLRSHREGGSIVHLTFDDDLDAFDEFVMGTATLWSKWPSAPEEELLSPTPVAFYGDAMLYSVFFSDPSTYAQSMSTAGKTAQIVFNAYSTRIATIAASAQMNSFGCDSIYSSAVSEFDRLVPPMGDLSGLNMLEPGMMFEGPIGTTFDSLVQQLVSYNEQAQLESCASIY